mmetsp:Transcript_11945/g.28514  ORF Transcript_11945/g.28514 Transcript_11945/m.28514 type:complete len:209 (+) Transcript_11945:1111-1737(+)
MAVEGESGTKFCMAWAVWHFRIGSGRLEESSTVVTGSAAIQKRIEAICSKLRQSKPTEKTGTASNAAAVARLSWLLSSHPFVTAVSRPWRQSSSLSESPVKCGFAVKGVGNRSSTGEIRPPSASKRPITSSADHCCSRTKNAPRSNSELQTAPGLREHVRHTQSLGSTSCKLVCRNVQKSKIVSRPSGPCKCTAPSRESEKNGSLSLK